MTAYYPSNVYHSTMYISLEIQLFLGSYPVVHYNPSLSTCTVSLSALLHIYIIYVHISRAEHLVWEISLGPISRRNPITCILFSCTGMFTKCALLLVMSYTSKYCGFFLFYNLWIATCIHLSHYLMIKRNWNVCCIVHRKWKTIFTYSYVILSYLNIWLCTRTDTLTKMFFKINAVGTDDIFVVVEIKWQTIGEFNLLFENKL